MSDQLFTTKDVLKIIPEGTYRKCRKEKLVFPSLPGKPGISDHFTFDEVLHLALIKKCVDHGFTIKGAADLIGDCLEKSPVFWPDNHDYLVVRSINGQYVFQDLMDPEPLPKDDEDAVIIINLQKLKSDVKAKLA